MMMMTPHQTAVLMRPGERIWAANARTDPTLAAHVLSRQSTAGKLERADRFDLRWPDQPDPALIEVDHDLIDAWLLATDDSAPPLHRFGGGGRPSDVQHPWGQRFGHGSDGVGPPGPATEAGHTHNFGGALSAEHAVRLPAGTTYSKPDRLAATQPTQWFRVDAGPKEATPPGNQPWGQTQSWLELGGKHSQRGYYNAM